jgi:hypothetical protein
MRHENIKIGLITLALIVVGYTLWRIGLVV